MFALFEGTKQQRTKNPLNPQVLFSPRNKYDYLSIHTSIHNNIFTHIKRKMQQKIYCIIFQQLMTQPYKLMKIAGNARKYFIPFWPWLTHTHTNLVLQTWCTNNSVYHCITTDLPFINIQTYTLYQIAPFDMPSNYIFRTLLIILRKPSWSTTKICKFPAIC